MNRKLQKPIQLLWTGGWDSSFWLAYATLVKQYPVQPYYVIDPERRSTRMEFQSMCAIRRWLVDSHSDVAQRLLPTRFVFLPDVPPNAEITNKYRELRRQDVFGVQVEWLARVALENSLTQLHLCVENEVRPIGLKAILNACLMPSDIDDHPYYMLPDTYDGTALDLFKPFVFPVFHLTKIAMENIACTHGFDAMLALTWFCHRPVFGSTPCGVCSPCKQARLAGLRRRLSVGSQFRYYCQKGLTTPAKRLLKRAACGTPGNNDPVITDRIATD